MDHRLSTRAVRCRIGIVGLLTAAVIMVSCSSDDSTDIPAGQDDPATTTVPSPPPTDAADGSTDEPLDTVEREDLESPPGLLGLDLPGITDLQSVMGAPGRPTLSWAPMDGATAYIVLVRTAEGGPFWATTTSEATVTVEEGLDPLATGARVEPGMQWTVIALDPNGAPIAQSAIMPL